MNEDYYLQISESIQKAFAPISDVCTKFMPEITDNLITSAETISNLISSICSTEQIENMTLQLASLSKAVIPNISNMPTFPVEIFDFLKNIDFDGNYVNLAEDDCNTINTILKSSNTVDVPVKISKGKIALTDFIKTVLIPILAILLPMIQNSYYHKVNSIESQKAHIEELQLQEKQLQIREQELQIREQELHIAEQQLQNDIEQKEVLENILTELQYFPEYFESLPEVPECPDEAQKPFGEVPDFPAGTQDNDLSNPDVSNNSEIDIHKE